jgi:hypothetical protein
MGRTRNEHSPGLTTKQAMKRPIRAQVGTIPPKASVQSHLPRPILIIEVKRQKSPAFEPHRFYAGFLFQLHEPSEALGCSEVMRYNTLSTYILLSTNQKRMISFAES